MQQIVTKTKTCRAVRNFGGRTLTMPAGFAKYIKPPLKANFYFQD
jgi:hypothetical protein